MADLTSKWKSANPTLTTADQVAAFLFSSGETSTFVLDNNDSMADSAFGFGGGVAAMNAFTLGAQIRASGIGYRLTQTYSAGGNKLGTYTIDRKAALGAITVNKNGP